MGISHRKLEGELAALGVEPGARLIVHTAMSQVGFVEGGARTLVRALQEAVTEDGLLVIPAFTYGRRPFDPRSRPVIGAVPEEAVQLPGFHRTLHPTHSFSLWGRDAASLAERHREEDAIGPSSPLFHLYENGGRVLLIGVDHRANTSIHLGEYLAPVPYGRPQSASVRTSGGFRTVEVAWRPACSEGFQRAHELAVAAPGYRLGTIGRAPAQLIPIRPLVDSVAERLRREPAWLLGHCAWCAQARRLT